MMMNMIFILVDYPKLSIAMAGSWTISPGCDNSVSISINLFSLTSIINTVLLVLFLV